jgi:hypothetical protein
MVKGVMVLMKGVRIGTLYRLLGNVKSIGCNNIYVSEVNSNLTRLVSSQAESIQTDSTSSRQVNPTMLRHEMMRHIGEKGL